MTRAELIAAMSTESGMKKNDCDIAINAFTKTIMASLKEGKDVKIVGFGRFFVREHAARTGRNPKTGDSIQINATKTSRFKGGKEFKSVLNG